MDVAVVLQRADWQVRRDVIDLATDIGLEHDLDFEISPIVFERQTYEHWRAQERPLIMDIERDGIPL